MMNRAKFLQGLLLVLAAATLVNCSPAVPCNIVGDGRAVGLRRAASGICGSGGGGGGTPTCSSTLKPAQVMFSVDSTGKVLEYGIDSTTGALTLMCNTGTAALGPLAVSNNSFLYILDTSTTPAQVFGFVIAHGNSGALAAITGSPFPLSEEIQGPASIVADPLGRFIFVTNNSLDFLPSATDVHVLTIGQSGALTEAATSPTVVQSPDYVAVTPSGAFVYVPDSTDGDIFIFSVDANGKLTGTIANPLIISNFNDFAHFAVVHPNGNFLLTANLQSISSFAIDPNPLNGGLLTEVAGSPYSPAIAGDSQVAPLTLTLDASGKFLYVTPEGAAGNIPGFASDNIIGFAIDTTGGILTPVPNSPFISSSTLDIVANPLLQQMFVVTSNTTSILFDVAPIDANGNLTLPTTGLAVTAEIHPVIANIN
ncbi:MAG: beta-propeller fold lactonase family protein [Candidatus Acidiferrales bacterium]